MFLSIDCLYNLLFNIFNKIMHISVTSLTCYQVYVAVCGGCITFVLIFWFVKWCDGDAWLEWCDRCCCWVVCVIQKYAHTSSNFFSKIIFFPKKRQPLHFTPHINTVKRFNSKFSRTYLLKRRDIHLFRVILFITHLFQCKNVLREENFA